MSIPIPWDGHGKKGIQEFPFPIQTSISSSLRLPYFFTSEEVSWCLHINAGWSSRAANLGKPKIWRLGSKNRWK